MSQNPVNRRTATKVEEGSEGNTTLLQSSDRRESKKNSIDDSVAMPNSKVSPPLRLVDQMMRQTPMDDLPTIPSLSSPQRNERPMLEPLENIVWPIEVEHVIDLVPDTSESRRRSPNVKSRNHSSVKSNESAQNQNGSNSDPPKKKSFFEKMFSNNKPSSPETQSTQETTSTEEIPILKPVRHETSPDGRGGEPLLPRIKKPESGQLARRKQKQPSQKSHTGQIVKIVDGKPVRDSTSLQRHPSKRRPEPPPAPPANNSSDEDDVLIRVGAPFMATSSSPEAFDDADYPPPVVTSVKTSKAEQKAFAEASQVRIPDTSQRPGRNHQRRKLLNK
uniref:Uncharacterized protein n=1 Tax=Caenorhabditis japonica TaxID=281687 RepID=A0A8R1IUN8_CAEJA